MLTAKTISMLSQIAVRTNGSTNTWLYNGFKTFRHKNCIYYHAGSDGPGEVIVAPAGVSFKFHPQQAIFDILHFKNTPFEYP